MAEPRILADVLKEYLFPNTEVAVDLKLLTRRPGRMKDGEMLPGAILRDSEEHYTFMQDASEKESTCTCKRNAPAVTRNPHVYEGLYINVNQRTDGSLYPTFCRPPYSDTFTFCDFCRLAAEELLMVARTFDQLGLVEESIGK